MPGTHGDAAMVGDHFGSIISPIVVLVEVYEWVKLMEVDGRHTVRRWTVVNPRRHRPPQTHFNKQEENLSMK